MVCGVNGPPFTNPLHGCFLPSTTLPFIFPELTNRYLQTKAYVNCADENKKLPFGPMSWPTDLPAPCYVPKTNYVFGL